MAIELRHCSHNAVFVNMVFTNEVKAVDQKYVSVEGI